MAKTKEIVSVIIPTYNEEKRIIRCLQAVKDSTYENVEIIVVDQSSEDNTRVLAEKYADQVIVRSKPKIYSPPSISRNIGAKHSNGQYLLNLDTDMIIDPCLIEDCVNTCKEEGCVAVYIYEHDVPENFWSKSRAVLEKEMMIKTPLFFTARFITKSAFKRIGGYDPKIESGEDWDLYRMAKKIGKVGITKTPIWHHVGKKYLFKNFKKMIDYGKTFDSYIAKYPKLAKQQLTPFRRMYIDNITLFLRHPILTYGFIILKFTEYLGAFIGLMRAKKEDKAHNE